MIYISFIEQQGREVVVFEELYQVNVLVTIHVDMEDLGWKVKFKDIKPKQPKAEKTDYEFRENSIYKGPSILYMTNILRTLYFGTDF